MSSQACQSEMQTLSYLSIIVYIVGEAAFYAFVYDTQVD